MRSVVYKIFIILTFLLLSVQLFDFIAIKEVKPDVLLLVVLYFAHKKGQMQGQIIGFGTGLAQDLFTIQLFGLNSFLKLIIGSLMGLIHRNFLLDNAGIQMLFGFFASVIQGILFILAKAIFDSIDVIYYITHDLWIRILYTTLLTPFIFKLLDFLEKHFGEA